MSHKESQMSQTGITVEIVTVEKHERMFTPHTRYYRKSPRLYVFEAESDPIHEIASGERYSKPHKAIRKHFPEIFKQLGMSVPKARWSQYAGCSCPCSPGFILDCGGRFNIHVRYRYVRNGVVVTKEHDPQIVEQLRAQLIPV